MFQKPPTAAILLGVAVLMLVFYAGKTYTESTIARTIIMENEENERFIDRPAIHHANTQTNGEGHAPHHHHVAEAAPIEVVTAAPAKPAPAKPAPAPTPAPRVVPPPAVPPPPFNIEELKPFANAQYGEDLYALKTFFPGKHGGTILESGALDGLLFSSTFVFELKMDWRAIHVEASPVSFAKLAKNRVTATNVNAALCESAGTVHYIGPENPAVSGAVGGIIEFMRPDMLEFNWPKDGAGTRHGIYGGGKAVIYPIECRRMDAILADSNVTHVDLWVLDVEGAELAVLQTIDLSKVRIDVIAIELDGGNKQKDEGVVKHLQANGYVVHSKYPEQNTWFVRKDFVVPSQ